MKKIKKPITMYRKKRKLYKELTEILEEVKTWIKGGYNDANTDVGLEKDKSI